MNIPGTFQIRYGSHTHLYYLVDDDLGPIPGQTLDYVIYPSPRSIVRSIQHCYLSRDGVHSHAALVSPLRFLIDTGMSIGQAYQIYLQHQYKVSPCISNHTTQVHIT